MRIVRGMVTAADINCVCFIKHSEMKLTTLKLGPQLTQVTISDNYMKLVSINDRGRVYIFSGISHMRYVYINMLTGYVTGYDTYGGINTYQFGTCAYNDELCSNIDYIYNFGGSLGIVYYKMHGIKMVSHYNGVPTYYAPIDNLLCHYVSVEKAIVTNPPDLSVLNR